MKKFSQQLNSQANKLKLKASEKSELKERLISYMEYHPLPAELKTEKNQNSAKEPLTEPFTTFRIPWHRVFKLSGAIAVFALILVPVFAERSVPGDTLYAIKVQFNEEIIGTLTFDSSEKVEWETERLNRRIAEARLLASEGRLTSEVEQSVAQAVRDHSATAQMKIEELRSVDADAATLASIALDTVLEFQSDSLRRGNSDSGSSEMSLMSTAVDDKPDLIALAIEESRVSSGDTSSSSLPSYAGMIAKIEQNTTRIYELIASLEGELTSDQQKEVVRRSEDIDRMLANAIETREEDEYLARVELLQTLQKTQRLIVFMTELDVFNSTDIDDLIPVVLTDKEELLQRTELNKEIDSQLEKLDALLPKVEDEAVTEKLLIARSNLNEQINNGSTTEKYRDYIDYAQSTLATIGDMFLIINQNIDPEELPGGLSTSTSNVNGSASSTTDISSQSTSTDQVVSSTEVLVDEVVTSSSSSQDIE